MDTFTHHMARLSLDWFNGRFGRAFTTEAIGEGEATAADGDYSLLLLVHRLYEAESAAWDERRRALEDRLSEALTGPYVLWVPPKADLPGPEPEETDFVRRVQLAAASLPPGGRAEAHFPARLRLARTRDEGAYVSVVGGLARHWTAISERAKGVFYLDSNSIHRLTADAQRRGILFDRIAEACDGLEEGKSADLEGEDSWTVQRLPQAPREFERAVLVGCPPSFDPTDGSSLRRLLRQRLVAARDRFGGAGGSPVRVLALVSLWEYAEEEGVTATLRGTDPALFSDIDVITVLADGGVRMALSPRSLPWGV